MSNLLQSLASSRRLGAKLVWTLCAALLLHYKYVRHYKYINIYYLPNFHVFYFSKSADAYKGDNMSAGSVCREADLKIPPHPKIPPAELQLSYSFTNVFNQHLHRVANCIHVINTMRDLLFPCHTDSSSAPAVSTSRARHCVRTCVRVHASTCAAQATHWRASSVITHTLTADYFLLWTRRESIKRSKIKKRRKNHPESRLDLLTDPVFTCLTVKPNLEGVFHRPLPPHDAEENLCSIAERMTTHGTWEECFHTAVNILLVPHDELIL